MHKDNLIVMAVIISVIGIVTGIMTGNIDSVRAELDNRTEFVYYIPALKEDIDEIKSDIKSIEENFNKLVVGLQ